MKPINQTLVLFGFIILFFSGCDKFKGDAGPAGPSLSGDLIGYSYLYDLDGNRATDNSGVTVTAEGTNIVATTAADGRWVLSGLTTGTYTFAFTKAGYGTSKSVGSQFVGGGQVYYGSASLYQIPPFTVTGLSATTSTGYINITGTLSGTLPTWYRPHRLFIGTSSTVSSDPKNYVFTYYGTSSGSSTTLSSGINAQSYFNPYGIYAGQTVYIVAYAESYGSTSYIDLSSGKYYYSSINPTPSNVVSVVVP
jgi:hypothetical protein